MPSLPEHPLIARSTRVVVLVEGTSDAAALHTLATRRALDLPALGIDILSLGGVTNIRRYLDAALARGLAVTGLCDEREAPAYRRALERAGLHPDLVAAGFFVCAADLEDELIRALGTTAVERVIERAGDLDSFRLFQREPNQRPRPLPAQLRRFMGTRSGRKERYAHLLVDALDLRRVPAPLAALLAAATRATGAATEPPPDANAPG